MIGKYAVRFFALGYLAVLLAAPVGFVFWRTFEHGVGPAWDAVTSHDAVHALKVTLILVAIAVPANTIFGVMCSLAIVRHRFPGAGVVNAVVDLPLALSPVVAGVVGSVGTASSSRCLEWCSHRSSSRCPSSCARSCPCCVRSARSRNKPPPPSEHRRSKRSAASPGQRSVGRRLTASS